MRLEVQSRYPPLKVALKDGRQIVLRPLGTDDAEALTRFYDSLPQETWRFYCPPRLTEFDAARKARRAASSTEVCLVAEDPEENEIAGYAWYRWGDSTSRHSIFGICLRVGYRGAGLGKALMTRLLEIAKTEGPPVMALTVQCANPRAVALYTKMGFQIVREQMRAAVSDFPAEPEYAMERRVR